MAKGVIQGDLNWNLIGIGALIGVACIVIDEALKRGTGGKAHLAPLAVGLGIYLPLNSTLTIVVGAVAGWWFERRAARKADPEATKQLGVLMASGLIVGESLLGVILAAVVVFSGNGAPLALVRTTAKVSSPSNAVSPVTVTASGVLVAPAAMVTVPEALT